MIYLLWVISLLIAFYIGYKLGDLTKKVKTLEMIVKQKIDKPRLPEEPKSEVIDPYDEVQTAIYEREKLMKKLNPNQ